VPSSNIAPGDDGTDDANGRGDPEGAELDIHRERHRVVLLTASALSTFGTLLKADCAANGLGVVNAGKHLIIF
jgi:hypothetical protein